MAVHEIYHGDAYQNTYVNGVHLEAIAELETDISAYSTNWAIGSVIWCKETGARWVLLPDGTSKEWTELPGMAVPPLPTSDGTFNLTATVTSGAVTLSWESAAAVAG